MGNNANYIVTNKIGPGTVLKIVRSGSGDVIPKIVEVISGQVDNPPMPNRSYIWDNDDIILIEGDIDWFNTIPEEIILENRKLNNIHEPIGVNTIGSLLNRQYDIRGDIPNPPFIVRPFLDSTIEPDTYRNTSINHEEYEIKKCETERMPIIGDKLCSRTAQLGTFRSQLNANDMQSLESMTPDPDIVNLSGISSELPKIETSEEIKESTLKSLELNDTVLIFEDYSTMDFTQSKYDLNFMDSIIEYICNKYSITDKNVILNNNMTHDEIKADITFPNGKFIIKLSDNSYELYDKQTNVIDGYFYGTYTTVVINKLGKFGKVSI